MLNMDTHGGTHTCTRTTHIHIRRGPGQQAHKPSATHFKMGTLRPREKPPHTPRPNTKARASAPLDTPGWAHQLMPGHRGLEQSRCRAHSLQGRQTLQPKEDAGATRSPTARSGAWQQMLTLSLGTSFPTHELWGAPLREESRRQALK